MQPPSSRPGPRYQLNVCANPRVSPTLRIMGLKFLLVPLAALSLMGCTQETDGETTPAKETPPAPCAIGERTLEDGSCQAAGVPPDACGEGFVTDTVGGCLALLPPTSCPDGEMAVPGEESCHLVAPCGQGPWGDIPVEGNTVYVDTSYGGGDGTGSAAKPWTTVQEGIDSASAGAIVAIAPGSYSETLEITGKAVRLWGKCPGEVELVGGNWALLIRQGGSGSEVHDLAVTGAAWGVAITGAENVLVDQVWFHDTPERALAVENLYGPTSVTVTGSLFERVGEMALALMGAALVFDGNAIRNMQPGPTGGEGRGISVQDDQVSANNGERGNLTVRRTHIESAMTTGIFVGGSDALVEQTVVVGTRPQASDGQFGRAISLEGYNDVNPRAGLTIRTSVLEFNTEFGIFATGGDCTIEHVTVRDTAPDATKGGWGRGINLQDDVELLQRSNATVRESLIERSHDSALDVFGSDVVIEGVAVRDTFPNAGNQRYGRGINVQQGPEPSLHPASVVITGSTISNSVDVGLCIIDAQATVDNTRVFGVAARPDGQYGDGVTLWNRDVGATIAVSRMYIEGAARAGIANFSGAIDLVDTVLECNAIDINGETVTATSFSYNDAGGNVCGCGDQSQECRILSSMLAPPEASDVGN
jgi:hypothetical protein